MMADGAWFMQEVFQSAVPLEEVDAISKDELYEIWERCANAKDVDTFLHRVQTAIIQKKKKQYRVQSNEEPRFKISASTLGISFIFKCPRLLHRLSKNPNFLDERAIRKHHDSHLSSRGAMQSKGIDHELWINSFIAKNTIHGVHYTLINVETSCPDDTSLEAYSMHLLTTAPANTVLYQAALSPKVLDGVYKKLGLEEAYDRGDIALSRSLLDYVFIAIKNKKRTLTVVDAKASKRVKLAHQVQVTFYSILLEIVAEIDTVGGIWLPNENEPQYFALDGLRQRVEHFILADIRQKLTKEAFHRDFDHDDDWRLQPSCLHCDFLSTCRQQALREGRLDSLPYIDQEDEVALREAYCASSSNNELEALHSHINTIHTPHQRTVKALSRIHLTYDYETSTWNKHSPSLEAFRKNRLTLTGLSCATLPYLSKTETGLLVIALDIDPRTSEPFAYFLELRSRNHQLYTRKQFVLKSEDFITENQTTPIALSPSVQSSIQRVHDNLINDLYELLSPLENERVSLCVFEEMDKTVLTDILLRTALGNCTNQARALSVLATFGTESKHIPLNRHANVYNLTNTADESRLFLPRLTVLHTAVRQLVVLPVPGLYTFEDVYMHLSGTKTSLTEKKLIATSCWREATFRIWKLRYDIFRNKDARGSRVLQLLAQRADCIVDIFTHLRSLKCDLPLKAAKVSMTNVAGPCTHPLISRLFFFSQLECATAIYQQRDLRTQPIELITQGQKAAVVRLLLFEADPNKKEKLLLTLQLVNGRADGIEIDKLENNGWILAPLSKRGALIKYADACDMEAFGPYTKLPLVFGSICTAIDTATTTFVWRTRATNESILKSADLFIMVPRMTDVTTSKILSQLIEEDSTPSLFRQILDDASAWCRQKPSDAHLLEGADSAKREFVPSTNSQFELYQRVISKKGVLVQGPPGSGKTYFSATCILRYARARLRVQSCTRILVSAYTHSALDNLLEKVSHLFEKYLKNSQVLICKADNHRPPTAIGEACVYKLEKRWVDAEVVGIHPEKNQITIRVGDEDKTVACSASIVRQSKSYQVMPTVTTIVNKVERDTHKIIILGATIYKTRTIMTKLSKKFNFLLVDEASQMLMSHAALVLSALDSEDGRLVVVGDTKQMPPTIRTKLPDDILNTAEVTMSLIAFLRKKLQADPLAHACVGELQENHRMCSVLCDFTTVALDYPRYFMCKKEVGCTCRAYRDSDLRLSLLKDWTEAVLEPCQPLVIIVLKNDKGQAISSLENIIQTEAAVCADLLNGYECGRSNVRNKKPMEGAFVVTPHHFQRRAVRDHEASRSSCVECDTVEKMQGREHDLTIACFAGLDIAGVNDSPELDFVFDSGRLIVSLSRAKKKLILLTTNALFNPSMHVFNSERRRQAERLLQRVYAYTAKYGRIFELRYPSRIVKSLVQPCTPCALQSTINHLPRTPPQERDGSETSVSSTNEDAASFSSSSSSWTSVSGDNSLISKEALIGNSMAAMDSLSEWFLETDEDHDHDGLAYRLPSTSLD